MNESPAPTVSTTLPANVGAEASSPVTLRPNTAPSAPRVTTTRDGPSLAQRRRTSGTDWPGR